MEFWFSHFRRDYTRALEHAKSRMAIATEQLFPLHHDEARSQCDIMRLFLDRPESVRQAYETFQQQLSRGFRTTTTGGFTLLGEACLMSGAIDLGTEIVAEGLQYAHQRGEKWYEPELWRLKGELARAGAYPKDTAETCFQRAIDLSHVMKATFWELRATVSLARLYVHQGRSTEARQLLANICNLWPPETNNPDLNDARELLISRQE